MKLEAVILEARRILQDINSPVRFSDAMLLGFANQGLKRMAVLRPDLFARVVDLPTTPGSVVQSAPEDSLRLMEVFHVRDGGGVTEVSRRAMDETYPGWMGDPPGMCVNWMRHVRNANRFFIYPQAPLDQVLVIEYAQSPRDYAADEDVELLPDAYFPVLVDGVVFLAESVDNEHVNSNRAQLFQQSFTQALGVSVQSRTITDTEEGGLPPEQVV